MTTSRARPSSQSSSSVFDRLYSKPTESSRLRQSAGKETGSTTGGVSASKNVHSKRNSSHTRRPRPVLKSKTNVVYSETTNGSSGVYDRLYSKGTASYNSKRKASSTKDESNITGENTPNLK
mmetsp:Transcript_13511/g.28324  ORF Transcript_13511/g.28324 Transcript_13511/m.28324 type:complete len:122 (+) Transcript_13511:184-549(+)|eukprot:CAMPEP_0168193434 /NCGR_PEP_ID=MMETSP0139_2-20121125/18607_1 /TAXON_ID=44445 /ORGANISM="Pseudo-nitzschia australis, Strain 10249 10 AB" /LENGTH=121 /DNA_ID=CAMNT_0008116795 /DNA_START=125 /DNA_END=490 /DNA_ORIENTATION=-